MMRNQSRPLGKDGLGTIEQLRKIFVPSEPAPSPGMQRAEIRLFTKPNDKKFGQLNWNMANRAPSLKVLLVEDNPRDAELIQEALQSGVDCEVRVALTEEAFKELLARHAPDIVISDSNVKSFDGFNALKITLSERPDIPFVFCSGSHSAAKHHRAMELGAAGWVTKEAAFDELLGIVKRLCARQLQPPLPRLVVISARDANWQEQLSSIFEQRTNCELRDIDQLIIAEEDFIRWVRDWCLKWHYSPTMCGLTTIQFRPR